MTSCVFRTMGEMASHLAKDFLAEFLFPITRYWILPAIFKSSKHSASLKKRSIIRKRS